jgi:exodeoxyribonuclease-5
LPSEIKAADVIICHTNKTRLAMTVLARELKGFAGVLPNVGERIIFLQNNRELGVFNGQQAEVLSVESEPYERLGFGVIDTVLQFDDGPVRRLLLCTAGFEALYADRATTDQRKLSELDTYRSGAASATFAHVITAHKAQGSEWGQVMVIDDHVGNDKRRWLYTAVTRARKEVSVVRPKTAYGVRVQKIRAGVKPLWEKGQEPANHKGLRL